MKLYDTITTHDDDKYLSLSKCNRQKRQGKIHKICTEINLHYKRFRNKSNREEMEKYNKRLLKIKKKNQT